MFYCIQTKLTNYTEGYVIILFLFVHNEYLTIFNYLPKLCCIRMYLIAKPNKSLRN